MQKRCYALQMALRSAEQQIVHSVYSVEDNNKTPQQPHARPRMWSAAEGDAMSTDWDGAIALKEADVGVPSLPRRCSSWVVVSRTTGMAVVETYSRNAVLCVNQEKYAVLTALDYLTRCNQSIADSKSASEVLS